MKLTSRKNGMWIQLDSLAPTDSDVVLRIGNVTVEIQRGFDPQGSNGSHPLLAERMLIGHPRQKVYLAVGTTDMRKSVDGLAAIVQLEFELNPFEPCLFAFCDRQRFQSTLPHRKQQQGRLPWPQVGEEVNPLDVTWQDLRQLLEGTPLKPVSQRAVKLPKYVI